MKRVFLCVVFVCVMAITAFAQEDFERKQQYLGISAGMLMSSGGIDVNGLEMDVESGASLGLQYINYFKRWERTHIGFSAHLGYSMVASEELSDKVNYGNTTYEVTYSAEGSTMNVGLGFNFKYELSERVDLLADVGGAYYINALSDDLEIKPDAGSFSGEAEGNTMGFFISGGANYLITPNIALGARISYVLNNYDKDGVKVDLGGVNILATLGYMF